MTKHQKRIISIGRDDRGNEHEIMDNEDGTFTDLCNERIIESGNPIHIYYSKCFLNHQVDLSSKPVINHDIIVAQEAVV